MDVACGSQGRQTAGKLPGNSSLPKLNELAVARSTSNK